MGNYRVRMVLLVAKVGPSYQQVTDRHDKLHDQYAA
ncbi:hypothetical protein WRSd3_02003 [Shigella dysenteriae WRSd3]|uniref:Uncharacterized protein n=1 Tax=Shigella dysenteriae WRSd3 TaxID=1401327 RepID=A0A090NI25_SHIDY|nr:hypothetical protein WRSd3_02003 [Shigella dysenteriae WRSd3]